MMFSNLPGIGWMTFGGRPRFASGLPLVLVLAICNPLFLRMARAYYTGSASSPTLQLGYRGIAPFVDLDELALLAAQKDHRDPHDGPHAERQCRQE